MKGAMIGGYTPKYRHIGRRIEFELEWLTATFDIPNSLVAKATFHLLGREHKPPLREIYMSASQMRLLALQLQAVAEIMDRAGFDWEESK